MGIYWILEDGKKEAETLESFLSRYTETNSNEFRLVTSYDEEGVMILAFFSENPNDRLEFKITQNSLFPADPSFEQEIKRSLLYMVTNQGRVVNFPTMQAYLNGLERLYEAVKVKNTVLIDELVKLLDDEDFG